MTRLHVIGWLMLAAACCGCGPSQYDHRVQYRVTGTARGAEANYRLPRGRVEQRTISVPFTSDVYWFHPGVQAFVEARDTGGSGDLRVEILVDGFPDHLFYSPRIPGPYTTNAYGTVRAVTWVAVQ